MLFTKPGGVLAALGYVGSLREATFLERLRLLPLLASAADLADHCQNRGIRHLHVHSFATAAHLAALSNRLTHLAYSLTLHGDLPIYGRDHAAKTAYASLLTAVTEPLAAQIRALRPDREVTVIWMGVDTDRFSPPPPRLRANGRPLHVVSVARLNEKKGHRFLLDAMARLRREGIDIRYSIAGSGPHREQIERNIAELGLTECVTMLGAIAEDEVLALLHGADALALPSHGLGEAAPVTVMEAMACGLPVVCSRIGGTPQMIVDGKSGFLVPQRDAAAIAEALKRLSSDPDLAERIGAAARRRAISMFDYRAQARKLLDRICSQAKEASRRT